MPRAPAKRPAPRRRQRVAPHAGCPLEDMQSMLRETRRMMAAHRREITEGIQRAEAAMLRLVGQQCDAHGGELTTHGERLDEHDRRIAALEQGRRGGGAGSE